MITDFWIYQNIKHLEKPWAFKKLNKKWISFWIPNLWLVLIKIYLKICDSVIMKYKDPNSIIVDDAVVDIDEDAGVSSENE